jgi:hypothetical protein
MTTTHENSTIRTPLPRTWIEKIFHKMLLDYGKKFVDQWGNIDLEDLLAHWANELSGYSGKEIQGGLTRMAQNDWPPSLPEFKKMCRPPINVLAAYHEAVHGLLKRKYGHPCEWSHPAIYWAATPMAFELESQTFAQVRHRWEMALTKELAHEQWPPIPACVPMLKADPVQRTDQREPAERRTSTSDAQEDTESSCKGRDRLAWARKILERAANGGDRHITLTVIKMAKATLGQA